VSIVTLDASILLAIRILAILVFGAAVLGKLGHRQEFVGVVTNYRLMPEVSVPVVATLVVGLEIAVVVVLSTGFMLAAGAALAAGLLCLFAAAMAINLARGRTEIHCGCFQSTLRQRLSVAPVVRNLLLIPVVLTLVVSQSQPPSLLQELDGVAAGAVLFVLYTVFDEMLALQHSAAALRRRFT
jgi:uncharacterized membrane protein YphA (DoxX/SURF4 family)